MSALLWFFAFWNTLGTIGIMVRVGRAQNDTAGEAIGSSLAVVTDVALTALLVWLAIHGIDG